MVENENSKYSKTIFKLFNSSEANFNNTKVELKNLTIKKKLYQSEIAQEIVFGTENKFKVSLNFEKGKHRALLTSNKKSKLNFPPALMSEILGTLIKKQILDLGVNRAFVITSERTGVSLFYKNLDQNKSETIDYILNNKTINPYEVFLKMSSRYAKPIQENIDFMRDFQATAKKESFLFKEKEKYSNLILKWESVLNGNFLQQNNSLIFRHSLNNKSIPLHISSSATKSLFLIDSYLRYEIKEGDILFIDEPELNLSAVNQVNIARFLIELVKSGISVYITTHSDYIAREINLFIGKDKFNSLKKQEFGIYSIDKNSKLRKIPLTEQGFSVKIFDDVISSQLSRSYNND
jgi:predicted ATPase